MAYETPRIEATRRDRIGSVYARRLRREGRLPAVVYGHQRDTVPVSVDSKELIGHLKHGAHVLTLDVDGGETETVLVKELQFGYLGDDVIHVDFARVNLEEEVEVRVHLNFVGTPKAALQAGAIVSHDMTDLEVVCRVDDIPEEIKVDLSQMEGMALTVGDLKLPPGIRAVADEGDPVTHVSFVRAEEEAVGEEAEVTGEAEPELITEEKAEGGEEAPETEKEGD